MFKLFCKIYMFPGEAIVWFRYHFPGKGKLLASARDKKSTPVKFFESTMFWLILGIFPALALYGELVRRGFIEG